MTSLYAAPNIRVNSNHFLLSPKPGRWYTTVVVCLLANRDSGQNESATIRPLGNCHHEAVALSLVYTPNITFSSGHLRVFSAWRCAVWASQKHKPQPGSVTLSLSVVPSSSITFSPCAVFGHQFMRNLMPLDGNPSRNKR